MKRLLIPILPLFCLFFTIPVFAQTVGTLVVDYHADGAESGIAVEDHTLYQPGETVVILGNLGMDANDSPQPLVREGYVFNSWNTKPDGSGQSFRFGDRVPIHTSLSLYPEWTRNAEPVLTITNTLFVNVAPSALLPDSPFTGAKNEAPKATEPSKTSLPPVVAKSDISGDDFFSFGENIPDMPATGFAMRRINVPLPPQPAELAYKTINYYLEIPVLDVVSEIVVAPKHENSWAVLWLHDRTGLLEGTALPGQGISLLSAHNHLNNAEIGPFLFIRDLTDNARIFIRDPQDKLLEFSVYANELYAPDELRKVEKKAREFENVIVLITCEDEMVDGGYAHRRVLFAHLIEE